MKRNILSVALVAAVCCGTLGSTAANAQDGKETPHKIGLIDMAYVFKNYQKFKDLREDLKKSIQDSDARAKSMVEELKGLQAKLKDNKTYKKDSPQVKAWRKRYIELTAQYQSYRQEEQAKFLERQAQIYKTVYMEVAAAVKTYAKYYNYTLILRWNSEGVDKAKDAKEILSKMNRLVIYVQEGQDITGVILKYVNGNYAKQANGGGGRPRAAGGVVRPQN